MIRANSKSKTFGFIYNNYSRKVWHVNAACVCSVSAIIIPWINISELHTKIKDLTEQWYFCAVAVFTSQAGRHFSVYNQYLFASVLGELESHRRSRTSSQSCIHVPRAQCLCYWQSIWLLLGTVRNLWEQGEGWEFVQKVMENVGSSSFDIAEITGEHVKLP